MNKQVETAQQLLQDGFRKTDISTEELTLLIDLHQQLHLFCVNFTANGDHNVDKIMTESLQYLACHINSCTNNTTNTNAYTPNLNAVPLHNETTRHELSLPKLGAVTTDIQNGKLIYLLDGQALKFKKMNDTTIYHHRWEENYRQLREYYNNHGNCRVTRGSEGCEELGNWVMEQRRKLKNGKLTQRQFERLNELGFEWNRLHYFFRTYHGRTKKKRGELAE